VGRTTPVEEKEERAMSGAHQWETHIDQALRPLGESLADEK
jgi:hypothetical protein